MPTGIPIEIAGLSKHFGPVTAVDDLSFTVEPGKVTGFLGPNGAGKTTTLRVLLGLVRPSARHRDLRRHHVPRPRTTARDRRHRARRELPPGAHGAQPPPHLRDRGRHFRRRACTQVLDQVGISEFADRRVGGYSLGMRQRLALAYTLLGDPGVLVLDEPINGLDPEGIRWIRGFLQSLAHEGRTVLVCSHLLSEVQQSVDEVVIISQGPTRADAARSSSLELDSAPRTIVDSPDRPALAAALDAGRARVHRGRNGFIVDEPEPGRVGHAAFVGGVELSALHRLKSGTRGVVPVARGRRWRVMSFLRALAAEFQKVFTTRMWWLLAILLVGYVGLLAGGFGAFLGWATTNPDAAAATGGNTRHPARHRRLAAHLQLRRLDRLRLPGAARRPRGHERVPPQDAHSDVPRRSAPAGGAQRQVPDAARRRRRPRRAGVRRVGRSRRCGPRRLRPRHGARLGRHLGAHRARDARNGALGRRSASGSACS